MFAVNGYYYNGKEIDCRPKIKEVMDKLPSLKKTVIVQYLKADIASLWAVTIASSRSAEATCASRCRISSLICSPRSRLGSKHILNLKIAETRLDNIHAHFTIVHVAMATTAAIILF